MKEFKLLRYFSRWWWLVVACSILGGVLFYRYAANSQTYVSQTVLAYINPEAEFGKTPAGTDINVSEIMSSWVIQRALENAGVNESVDRVRSRISITEDIPDDIATVQKAAWAEGLEYEYFPTEFVISYNSGTDAGADDARAILEAVVDSYYQYYGKNYVMVAQTPSSVYALTAIEYDAIELVEALDAYADSILAYVSANAGYSPDFRSALTGYSFENLASEYELFVESTLPSLYAQVFGNRVSNDTGVLKMKYQKRIADNNREIQNLQTRADDIRELIDTYVSKNSQGMDYHWKSDNADIADASIRASNYVLGQVYEFTQGDYLSEQTTYDKLLLKYVSNNDAIEQIKQDNAYCESILTAYAVNGTPDAAKQAKALEALDAACARLKTLEDILNVSVSEYMEYRAAQNLAITSTVNVYSTMNTKLYLVLAVALFFIVGCVGAVVLGRGQDFVEYALYIDHTTNLPNRRRCDQMLDEYSQNHVEAPFSCMYLKITNIAKLNQAHGYSGGTQAIYAMGAILESCAESFGFVGYNDSAQYMGVFEGCTEERAEYFKLKLKSEIDAYNEEYKDNAIEYKVSTVSVGAGEFATARDLLRRAIAALGAPA